MSVSLKLEEFRSLYKERKIREDVLEKIILTKKGEETGFFVEEKVLHASTFHTQPAHWCAAHKLEKEILASTWTRWCSPFFSEFFAAILIRAFRYGISLLKNSAFWIL